MQMKSMKIVNVVNFPFPTNPGEEQLKRAEERLSALGALQYDKVSGETKEGEGEGGMEGNRMGKNAGGERERSCDDVRREEVRNRRQERREAERERHK